MGSLEFSRSVCDASLARSGRPEGAQNGPYAAPGVDPSLVSGPGLVTVGVRVTVQVAAAWHAESTVLHVATLLESVSPVRDLHPEL
ncbi:hypothetical protein [Aeromicrobium wangtongii]|uniref:hypothetical protein n=1 Tax=Aeromicrobium wangtongii TaxID=2969247 RepID=UPI00201723C3|nr:hypothetical protein [Aeromicrobium wangtongii]MCL3818585.1 hypothetical protein [Aeromicrobium wangtongii]